MPKEVLIDTLRRFNIEVEAGQEPKGAQEAREKLEEKTKHYPLATTYYDERSYIQLLALKAKVAAAAGETSASFWERITNESNNSDGDARIRTMGSTMREVRDHFEALGFEATVDTEGELNRDWNPPARAVRWTVEINWAEEPQAQAS
jgi:hypothetical protein